MNKQSLILVFVLGVLVLAGGAVMLSKRQKGAEEATTPGEAETTPGAAEECAVGGYWRVGGVEYRITGIETHSLGGKSMDLCCSKWEDATSGQKWKHCYDPAESDYYIAWLASEETGGEYVKSMESYRQNDQTCIKTYDLQGNVAAEACQ